MTVHTWVTETLQCFPLKTDVWLESHPLPSWKKLQVAASGRNPSDSLGQGHRHLLQLPAMVLSQISRFVSTFLAFQASDFVITLCPFQQEEFGIFKQKLQNLFCELELPQSRTPSAVEGLWQAVCESLLPLIPSPLNFAIPDGPCCPSCVTEVTIQE